MTGESPLVEDRVGGIELAVSTAGCVPAQEDEIEVLHREVINKTPAVG